MNKDMKTDENDEVDIVRGKGKTYSAECRSQCCAIRIPHARPLVLLGTSSPELPYS
jgi:hypothetical protein